MNRGIARQGFALITAVVISAAILATIVGIATLTVRETRVQAEQNASDQALAVAERGLADVVSRLRTDQALATTVIGLGDNVHWELTPSSGTMSPGGHAFYWVKVVPQGAPNPNRNYEIYAAGFIVRPVISSSTTSSQLKALAASPTNTIARRVVQVTGTMVSSLGPSAFDYGMFTGTSFSMVGSKDLANVTTVTTAGTSGIYATQDITMTSNHTVTDLNLYAEHAIDVGGVTMVNSISYPHYPSTTTFPTLDLEKYMDLFDAFVAGTAPFDGNTADYPDLSNALVRSAVLTALGNPQNNKVTVGGQVHHFVTPASLSSYADQVALSIPLSIPASSLSSVQMIALKRTLSKSVFYVRNSVGDPDAKWQSDRANLAGVIVCAGNVTFTGCPDFASGQVAAVLAQGNIDIAGSTSGNTAARGIFYSEGEVKYTGSGWFEGQIISQDTVRFTGSGNVSFTDYSTTFGDLLPGEEAVVNGFSQNSSGWTEKAWGDFPAS